MLRFINDNSARFSTWLQDQWSRRSLWHLLLMPLVIIFFMSSYIRRLSFRYGLNRSYRMPVPVIVVGNLTVGGTGKTPLVLWLVDFLSKHGYRPGIISRGYASRANSPQQVMAHSDPALVGDEPVLLAQRTQCPVWVGQHRVHVARSLLTANPECDVLISDDGLQHYRLKRNIEIVVIDGIRRFGNGYLIPAGPLREPLSRLKTVDAVVVNGGPVAAGEYAMHLRGNKFSRISPPKKIVSSTEFVGKRVHAVAGIGDPSRFFSHLSELGLQVVEHPFPDHYAYQPQQLQFEGADAILMTEKDAVKCTNFAPANAWSLAVDAQLDHTFGDKILEKLGTKNGCQTT